MAKKNEKVILFPGMAARLLEQAEQFASSYKFLQAVECYEQVFAHQSYDTVAENVLYMYAYCLHEIKAHEQAKNICEFVIYRKHRSAFYFEFVELYVSVCIDSRDYEVAKELIESVLKEGSVPRAQIEQFEHLKALNEKLATNVKQREQEEVFSVEDASEEDDHFFLDMTAFFKQAPQVQLFQLQQFMATNIRPYQKQLVEIVEKVEVHPFVQSIALLLLVEQQVDVDVHVAKFGQSRTVNAAQLVLPTKLPQFEAVQTQVAAQLEQDPSTHAMVEQLLAKHSLVTYPFEWGTYEADDVAFAYLDYVRMLFGEIGEMDVELVEFIQQLEKMTELL